MIAADFKVCLDACVLANHGVADLFLRLAERPRMYSPVMSRQILDEARRVHVDRLGWPVELADYFQQEVSGAFAEAMVEDYEDLIQILTNDEGDRHVLAAAIKGKAQLIVTFNLRHFRERDLKPWGIASCHPQDYLITMFEFKPEVVTSKLFEIAAEREESPQKRLAKLARTLPRFSGTVAEAMGWTLENKP